MTPEYLRKGSRFQILPNKDFSLLKPESERRLSLVGRELSSSLLTLAESGSVDMLKRYQEELNDRGEESALGLEVFVDKYVTNDDLYLLRKQAVPIAPLFERVYPKLSKPFARVSLYTDIHGAAGENHPLSGSVMVKYIDAQKSGLVLVGGYRYQDQQISRMNGYQVNPAVWKQYPESIEQAFHLLVLPE